MKSIKSTKSCAHRAHFFRDLFFYLSSIVIEGARTKLATFLKLYIKKQLEIRKRSMH